MAENKWVSLVIFHPYVELWAPTYNCWRGPRFVRFVRCKTRSFHVSEPVKAADFSWHARVLGQETIPHCAWLGSTRTPPRMRVPRHHPGWLLTFSVNPWNPNLNMAATSQLGFKFDPRRGNQRFLFPFWFRFQFEKCHGINPKPSQNYRHYNWWIWKMSHGFEEISHDLTPCLFSG